jgi:hypothetical protein
MPTTEILQTEGPASRQSVLIRSKKIAVLVASAYVFSTVGTVRTLNHAQKTQFSERMPIIMGVGYIGCIYFFLEIQRGTKNIFEKIMAFASAGAFILPLARILSGEFHSIPLLLFTSLYLDAALTAIATIAIIARTGELFVSGHNTNH